MSSMVRQPLSFADSAGWIFDFVGDVNATPAEVWAAFVDNGSWPSWFRNCSECRATSDPFGGVGSTRHIRVNGLTVDEIFIAWEPERLWAFTATQMRMSFATSLVERATFEPIGAGRTRIHYRMAMAPKRWARPIRRLVQSQAAKAFATSFARLDQHLAERRATS